MPHRVHSTACRRKSHERTVTYDFRGRRTTATDPLGKVTTWEYDDAGRLAAIVDRNGARRTFVYDRAGRLTSKTAGSRTTSYADDGFGRLVRSENGDASVALRYDPRDLVLGS